MPLLGAAPRRRPGSACGVAPALAILLAASRLESPLAVRLTSGLSLLEPGRSSPPLGRKRPSRRGLALGLAAAAGLIRVGEASEDWVSEAPQLHSDADELDNLDLEFTPPLGGGYTAPLESLEVAEAAELDDPEDVVAMFSLSAQHEDPEVRLRALDLLSPTVEEVPPGLAAIVKDMLWDSEFAVREAAMVKWMALRTKRLDISYLSSNTVHRVAAVMALSYLGPTLLPEQVDMLHKSLQDSDISVRAAAAAVMAKLCDSAWVDVHAVRRALAGDDVYLRRAAALALPEFVTGPDCVEDLEAALGDPDGEVRLRVLISLANLGPLSTDAKTSLRSLLVDEDPALQRSAVDLLAEMPGAAETTDLELLLDVFKNVEDHEAQWSAAIAFRDLGLHIWPGGLDGICDALLAEDVFVRRAASMAAANLEDSQPTEEQMGLIRQMLRDTDPFVRWTASQLFRLPAMSIWFGGSEEIHDALRHGDTFIGQAAASSLGSLGDALTDSDMQALLQAFGRTDFATRFAVISAIERLGAAAGQEGRDTLAEALNDQNPTVVETAMSAILAFQPPED